MAKNPPPPPPREPLPEPDFPFISAYIEAVSPDEVEATFKEVKGALGSLKGPKADLSKKAIKGVTKAEELLSTLMQVREKLEGDKKGKKGSKK